MFFQRIRIGCTTDSERAVAYATAGVSADTRADAVQGLDPAKSNEYPMLPTTARRCADSTMLSSTKAFRIFASVHAGTPMRLGGHLVRRK